MKLSTFALNKKNKNNVVFIILLFFTCNLISVLIPPFQSPDEFEHITRAYLLGEGEILLDAPPGQSSGGMIDSNLVRYMEIYNKLPFNPDRKITDIDQLKAKQLRWTDEKEFKPALGVAYYFPAVYVIHTLSLKAGKYFNLSIDTSYLLTRLILLISSSLILYLSFALYKPPYLVLTLLSIPMSLFQFASASLDGITTSLTVFLISIFLKISSDKETSEPGLFYSLIIAWLLVASSRLQLFPMILLAFSASLLMRKYRYFIISIIASALVIFWQFLIMRTIVDGRVHLGASSTDIILWYLKNPSKFLLVLSKTLTNVDLLHGYFSSFFGLLGWLDAPFSGSEYKYLFVFILVIALGSLSLKGFLSNKTSKSVLLVSALGALGTIFIAMLVTWTPHPAILIDGVQGRYFLIPALLVAYAFSNGVEKSQSFKDKFLLLLVLCFGIYSSTITAQLLISRYFL
jgi:uncharacterized membrane protein